MTPLEATLFKTLTGKAWKKIGVYPHHGINIPLSGIWTEKSGGVGEFFDLLPLIQWCHKLKLDVIQLLPLNESGIDDPSPYNALSSCALHPIYLSLHALPYLDQTSLPSLTELHALKKTKKISYREVVKQKFEYLRSYLAVTREEIKKEEGYVRFLETEKWLFEYAAFKVFKDEQGQKHWKDWPEEKRDFTKNRFKRWLKTYAKEIEFYCLIQYLCFSQLKEVKAYAERKKVWLKGDIPILVNPDSADVCAHRTFFDLSQVAGRPPSQLEPKGQYWGFPLYNWRAMEENHYEWWKKRLETASKLYHIYRIDHIIGFFSLWAIPEGKSPEEGRYTPDLPDLMEAQGREILKTFIELTDLLPIGEDLGDFHPFTRKCLTEYGICGTKIFRWEREWEKGGAFIPCASYSPISMTSVSTHDLDTVSLWWQKSPEEAKAYAQFKRWKYEEKLGSEKLREILWDNHHSGSLFHINLLQEYLAATPHLTFDNLEDERINYPGTMGPHNWVYRYKKPLEVLTSDPKLADLFHSILSKKREQST